MGVPGRSPAAAQGTGSWYAVSGSHAIRFHVSDRHLAGPEPVAGIAFGRITDLRVTHDGEVFTWKAPRFWFGSKTFVQKRHGSRRRLRRLEDGLVAVMGPYEL